VTEGDLRRWLDDVEMVLEEVEFMKGDSLREKTERFAVAEARAKAMIFAPPPDVKPPPGFVSPELPDTSSPSLQSSTR
jgi:hypothetical protein